jgi:hypothetical protein
MTTEVDVEELFVNVSKIVADKVPVKYENMQTPKLTPKEVVLPTAFALLVETPMNQLIMIVRLTALLQLSWGGRVMVRDEDVLLVFFDRIFRLAFIKVSEIV